MVKEERLAKEFERTEKALKAVKATSKDVAAEELLDLANRYYKDAKYFKEKGDLTSAFGALNYAFGLLDAGVKLKAFSIRENATD